MKADIILVFRQKRPVPYAIQAAVKAELNRLVRLGILSPITYLHWAAPIVVVKKGNGALRLCADFSTGLNKALELHQSPLPSPEDIFATLGEGTIFSHIDLSDAYFQIEVDDETKITSYKYAHGSFLIKSFAF